MKRLLPLRNSLKFVSFAVDTSFGSLQIRRAPTFLLPLPIHFNHYLDHHLRYGQATRHRFSTKTHPKEHKKLREHPVAATMNGTGPTTRSKRKNVPSPATERPNKQSRQFNGKVSPSENTPDEEMAGYMDTVDVPDDEEVVAFYQAQPGDSAEWQMMIQKVVRSVVSIRFCQTCSFDTDAACASEATGFVVDAEEGLVTTYAIGRVKEIRVFGADWLILALADTSLPIVMLLVLAPSGVT